MLTHPRKLYPEIEPYNTGMLKVSDIHSIYYEEAGNKNGKPVVYLHGGPGAGISADCRRFFDPEFYRIILFDQRGAGKSTPHAELKDNTTQHLVEDMEKLRKELNVDKWLVFGGSWGSTLALTYAIHHKENVSGLVLRGIFLGRKDEIDWNFQGNGSSNIYPDKWEPYYNFIPDEEKHDMVKAYYKRLTSENKEERLNAARIWSVWEGNIINLLPNEKTVADFGKDETALSVARTECHYFINKMFNETDNYILENVHKIKDIPCRIVHGRYDMNCRMVSAWELHKALPQSELRIVPDAGHSSMEPGIISELVQSTDDFKNII